jgi:hypothetical protein
MRKSTILTFCVTALAGGFLALAWTWLRAPSCGLHPRYEMSFLKYAADKSISLMVVVALAAAAVYVIQKLRAR